MACKVHIDDLVVIQPDTAGIDVGSESHWVSVPADRDTEPVREFSAMTHGLLALADWLQQCGIRRVAMESTGIYWIALYELLCGARLGGRPGRWAQDQACLRAQERPDRLPLAAQAAQLRPASGRFPPRAGGLRG